MVVAGPGSRLLSPPRWVKVVVKLRMLHGEILTVESPLLGRENEGRIVPTTGAYMAMIDQRYIPLLKLGKATIHIRRRVFATAAICNCLHMA